MRKVTLEALEYIRFTSNNGNNTARIVTESIFQNEQTLDCIWINIVDTINHIKDNTIYCPTILKHSL
jgi:hypothetical protein